MPINAPITFTSGTIPSGLCFTSEQDRLNYYSAMLRGYLPGKYTTYVISDSEPGVTDRDKLWARTVAGNLEGIYQFGTLGKWIRPHPESPNSGLIKLYNGDPANVPLLDGGNTNTITPTDGAFWQIVTDMAGMMPIGVGNLPVSGTSIAVTQVGGSDQITQSVAQMPAHTHMEQGQLSSTGGGFDTFLTAKNISQPTQGIQDALLTDSTGSGQSMNIMNPYYGVYYLTRTARIYITA